MAKATVQTSLTGAVGSTTGDILYDTSTGSMLHSTTTGWSTLNTTLNNYSFTEPTFNDLTIKRKNGKEIRVGDTIEVLMERLCVILPEFEKMERYPALKEAYDNYKLMEAMLANEDGND